MKFFLFAILYHFGILTKIMPLPVFETIKIGVMVIVRLTFGFESPRTFELDYSRTFSGGRNNG